MNVLVTGGNAGIGKALCKLLATSHGCHVFMGSRSVQKGQDAVAEIAEESPESKGKIQVIQIDTMDSASVASAAEAMRAILGTGTLYAIVNNAGTGLAHGVSASQVLDTNLYGPKRVCDSFLPLLDKSSGRVVNVGSGLGPSWMSKASSADQAVLCSSQVTWTQIDQLAQANLAAHSTDDQKTQGFNAYGLSKAGVMSYTVMLAREYPSVTSSTISPGFIMTAMTTGFGAKITPEEGTVSIRHALFAKLGGNGWMFGSDAKRSPLDASRDPGTPEYTDPTGRGF